MARHFTLELDDGTIYDDPTASEVAEAIASLDGEHVTLAILRHDAQTYAQVSGGGLGGFEVEYQDGSVHRHFAAAEPPTISQVTRMFQAFADGDPSFRSACQWKPMELPTDAETGQWEPRPQPTMRTTIRPRGGCAGVIVVAAATAAALAAGCHAILAWCVS
jgi:hypothetical protein